MNGGTFFNLTGDLAYKAFDKLADNSQQWDFTSCRDKSTRNPKKGGIHELKGKAELNLRMDAIVKRLDALNVGQPINAANTLIVESCSIRASSMHLAQTCPFLSVFSKNQMEQVNAYNDFRKQSSGLYSESYNLGWRNHPNFSWKQNQPTNLQDHFRHIKVMDARLSQCHHLIRPPLKPQRNRHSHWKIQ
jgi:hypothetical protein